MKIFHPEELVIKRRAHFVTEDSMRQTPLNAATDAEICQGPFKNQYQLKIIQYIICAVRW